MVLPEVAHGVSSILFLKKNYTIIINTNIRVPTVPNAQFSFLLMKKDRCADKHPYLERTRQF